MALFDGATLIAGDCRDLGRGHAEALVPMIASLPERGRAERIMVNLGPGSFTGIRVGIAAARALALVWQVPVGGYHCLALVAAMARDRVGNAGTEAIDVVMTGGHGEWFFQRFDSRALALAGMVSCSPSDVLAQARAPVVAGSQAAAVAERTGARAMTLRPDARAFALLDRAGWLASTSPIYGRAPDARLPATAVPAV